MRNQQGAAFFYRYIGLLTRYGTRQRRALAGDYIHNNPVEAGFITAPTQWKYSSARNIAEEDPAFDIDAIGFLN